MIRARAEDTVVDQLAAFDDAGHVEELLAGFPLEFAPQLVRAPKERDVVGVLEVGEPDDPGEPVRGALLVEDVEALEPEHPLPAPGEVVEGRAPHSPDPDDHDVVALGHSRRDPTRPHAACSPALATPSSDHALPTEPHRDR